MKHSKTTHRMLILTATAMLTATGGLVGACQQSPGHRDGASERSVSAIRATPTVESGRSEHERHARLHRQAIDRLQKDPRWALPEQRAALTAAITYEIGEAVKHEVALSPIEEQCVALAGNR